MVIVDINAEELASFIAGVVSLAIGLIGYSRKKGVKLLPKELADLQLEVKLEGQGGNNDPDPLNLSKLNLENISIEELAAILIDAKKLGLGGYTQGEIEEIGLRIIRAAARPGNDDEKTAK
jgi:hypothetical protein